MQGDERIVYPHPPPGIVPTPRVAVDRERAMTRARARQRNVRGEGGRLREEIIEATVRLIDTGADGLSLRAIAREAGVAGPSLYDHFAGVEDIRNAVIRSCYDALTARIQVAQAGARDPVARLDATCDAYASYGADFPHRYAQMFREARDDAQRAAVGEQGAAALETLVESIADCRRAGTSASEDPYGDAVAVWSALHGLTTLRAIRPHFATLQADSLMRTVVHRVARITPGGG